MPWSGSQLADAPDVLTVPEAARLLRLGINGTYEAIRRKEIPAVRLGHRLIVPKRGIERMLSGEPATPPAPQLGLVRGLKRREA